MCEFVETVLVISLTVIDYFSKKVVNDVIKLEVSTGVGIFLRRATANPGQKSDIESFSKVLNYLHQTYAAIVLYYML